MEILILQAIALMGMIALAIVLCVTNYREFKYRKKIEFLTHLVDKDFETCKIDLNKL